METKEKDIPEIETQNLNVVSDEASIYEGGQLRQINIRDLLGNEVATRQLINSLNLANRERESLKSELDNFRIENASGTLTPVITVVLSLIGVAGAILVGLGANYLGLQNTPPAAGWILFIGIILSLLSAILNPLLPILIASLKKKRNDNAD